MNLTNSANINYLWASLIIEELIRNGVDYFCISPGSRSSPLAIAVASNPRTQSFIHFDERGSAFHALGYSSAAKNPCAIITTSGTAVANLFPAVIEASKKKLPLIVLTADRPPELRFTGAHQTIDQVKIFGGYVRWQFDMPCPTQEIAPEFVLTTIDQAVFQAKKNLSGPVHLNCMYREPLAAVPTREKFSHYLTSIRHWGKSHSVYTQYLCPESHLNEEDINIVLNKIKRIKNGIIVAGKLSTLSEQQGILKLAQKLNWPIFPDISSGMRLESFGEFGGNVIHYFDQILLCGHHKINCRPDGVIHLGGRITSKRWYDFIEQTKPKEYLMVINHPLRNDPLHIVNTRIQSRVDLFCNTLHPKIAQRKPNQILIKLKKLNRQVDQTIEKFLKTQKYLSELETARLVSEHIPREHGLFLASSLSIREMDMYAFVKERTITVESLGSNRGASGIDGTIATAVGFSMGLEKKVTLLIGDLAFLHDLNSLAMLKNLKKPLVVVVLNNNGGGIFSFLPIYRHVPSRKMFEKYFGTPHDLGFEKTAALFNLTYYHPKTKKEFILAYQKANTALGSSLIEVESKRSHNLDVHQRLQKEIICCLK